jgi:hypothetical protein
MPPRKDPVYGTGGPLSTLKKAAKMTQFEPLRAGGAVSHTSIVSLYGHIGFR